MVAVRVLGDAVVEGFGHGAQAGQRGPQVVGDPGHQLAPGLLHPVLPLPGSAQPLAAAGELSLTARNSRGPRDSGDRLAGSPSRCALSRRSGLAEETLGEPRARTTQRHQSGDTRQTRGRPPGRGRRETSPAPSRPPPRGSRRRRPRPPAPAASASSARRSSQLQQGADHRRRQATRPAAMSMTSPGRGSRRRLPAVADTPHGHQPDGAASGRPRPSPAAGGRAP